MRTDTILLAGLLSLVSSTSALLHQHAERAVDLSLDPSYSFDYDVATLGDIDYSDIDIDIDSLPANETDISDIEVIWGPSSPELEEDASEDSNDFELVRRQALTRGQKCAKGVHVIAAGGNGAGDPHRYGNIQTLVYNITAKIPGSNSVSLPYNKGSSHGIQMTQNGSKMLLRYLRAYHNDCPKTKIVLAGYSAGAIITMNVLCGASSNGWKIPGKPLQPKWTKTIVASVVYGDETYTAHQPYNRGTCAKYGGQSRFPRKKPQGCAAFQSRMLAYCNYFDPQCCQGRWSGDHFTYFAQYDDEASNFVRQKWLAAR